MRVVLPPLLFALCLGVAAPALGQPDPTDELLRRVLVEGGDAGDQAAFQLFRDGEHDGRLRAILADRRTKKESRLCVLRALKYADPARWPAAYGLLLEALDDPSAAVQSQAVGTFATLEGEPTYTYVGRTLGRLRWAPPESRRGRQARALVEVLERMRDPQRATGELISVLSGRLHRALEQRVRETLERLTAQRWVRPSEWRTWWEGVRGLSLTGWRREIAKERTLVVRRIEGIAEQLYGRLLALAQSDPDRLLGELERGLLDETVPGVTRRAIGELGRLATPSGAEEPIRARALALLRGRLQQGLGTDYDQIQGQVALALGQTGDPAVLPDLLALLGHPAPQMRAAAAGALGALGNGAAVAPLVGQLDEEDPELVEAVLLALGSLKQNPVLEGEGDGELLSAVIVRFARRLMALNGAVGPTSAGHLARAAEALGKLPYPDAAAREPAAALLGELAAWPNDPNVRSAAVTALGTFDGAGVLDLLAARLDQEPEVHVRKAVAGAIGQQALSFDDERRPRAVALLVPFLFTTTEAEVALRRRSQQRLEELAQGPSFAGLELIVDTLGKATEERAARQAALAFLLLLPPLDAVPADRRERYVRLLERRAAAQLEAGEAAAALSDYDVVGVVRG